MVSWEVSKKIIYVLFHYLSVLIHPQIPLLLFFSPDDVSECGAATAAGGAGVATQDSQRRHRCPQSKRAIPRYRYIVRFLSPNEDTQIKMTDLIGGNTISSICHEISLNVSYVTGIVIAFGNHDLIPLLSDATVSVNKVRSRSPRSPKLDMSGLIRHA